MRLNQVTVAATNIERSIVFYQQLGLQLIVQAPHYARFVVPGNEATFSIHRLEKPFLPSETVVYFECEDLENTVNTLKNKGLVFERELQAQSWLWTEAYLRDPDGNQICLFFAGENRLNPPWRV